MSAMSSRLVITYDARMDSDVVVLHRYAHVTQAELAQSVLAGSEIESFIDVPFTASMFPHYALGSGWVSLMVREEDAARAEEVLAASDLLDGEHTEEK